MRASFGVPDSILGYSLLKYDLQVCRFLFHDYVTFATMREKRRLFEPSKKPCALQIQKRSRLDVARKGAATQFNIGDGSAVLLPASNKLARGAKTRSTPCLRQKRLRWMRVDFMQTLTDGFMR
jgi:hypothetical protein